MRYIAPNYAPWQINQNAQEYLAFLRSSNRHQAIDWLLLQSPDSYQSAGLDRLVHNRPDHPSSIVHHWLPYRRRSNQRYRLRKKYQCLRSQSVGKDGPYPDFSEHRQHSKAHHPRLDRFCGPHPVYSPRQHVRYGLPALAVAKIPKPLVEPQIHSCNNRSPVAKPDPATLCHGVAVRCQTPAVSLAMSSIDNQIR